MHFFIKIRHHEVNSIKLKHHLSKTKAVHILTFVQESKLHRSSQLPKTKDRRMRLLMTLPLIFLQKRNICTYQVMMADNIFAILVIKRESKSVTYEKTSLHKNNLCLDWWFAILNKPRWNNIYVLPNLRWYPIPITWITPDRSCL